MSERLIVIGGTAAGLSAASRAKKLKPEIEITVFEKSGFISYGACGLPYYVGDKITEATDLVAITASEMQEKRGITAYIHREVTDIDRLKRTVTVKNLDDGSSNNYSYDKLVIATGARPIVPQMSGVCAEGVCYLRTVEDGIKLKQKVAEHNKAVIVGGGFIGLELTEALTESGLQVSLCEAAPRLLPFLNEDFSETVNEELKKHGVELLLDSPVRSIKEKANAVKAVETENGVNLPCDLAILSIGVTPETHLATSAGIQTGLKGGIVVDKSMKTNDVNIWACGDCVEMEHIITGKPVYIPLGTTANKQGRIAGSNIGGKKDSFPGVLGSIVTKVFDLFIAATGLSLEEAKAAGFTAETTTITQRDKASYYPGAMNNSICLIFDSKTGRILGAQGIGSESIAGRINVLVAAITAQMTVSQVNELDLVYAPPVAPVYDPILIAASNALKSVAQDE